MTIFQGDILNKEELEQWYHNLGIKVNQKVTIQPTVDRGIAVFYNPTKNTLNEKYDQPIELLRIPKLSSYNIYTLQTLVNEKLKDEDKKVVKRCLNIVFSKCHGASESLILIAYFIGFLLICRKEKNIVISKEWKKDIGEYLSVLMNTIVGNLYSDQQDILQDFVSEFRGNVVISNTIVDITGDLWINVVEGINDEFNETYNEITLEEVLQICSAIRSRVLEIPREADDDDETDDYYVDVTLVPMLDYVNHNKDRQNAYFDVDRDKGDVVLYLDSDKVKDIEKPFEVFISYDKFEDLHRMFMNYGFIPTSANVMKVIEIPILGYCEDEELNDYEITRRLYSIRQTPNVQFKIIFDKSGEIKELKVLDDQFYSYLGLINEINWEQFEKNDEEEMNEINEQADSMNDEDRKEFLDAFSGLDYSRGFNRCYELLNSLKEEEIYEAKRQFAEYVKKYFEKFSNKIEKFKEIVHEYELNKGETTNIIKLIELYELISNFILKDEKKASVAELFIEDKEDEKKAEEELSGFLENRMVPVYNFDATIEEAEVGELRI